MTELLRTSMALEEFVVDTEASVGVARFPEDGTDLDTLLQKADVAMYHAKERHSGFALYDVAHDHHSPAKLALAADLRTAVDAGQLMNWYQPLIDIRTGRVVAVEALVRWQHPQLGLLQPDSFLELAERTSLIKPLTQQVLKVALRDLGAWRAMGIDLQVAVNLSTRVLVDRDLIATVQAALTETGTEARHLKLEVTESALMSDPELARSVLLALDRVGVGLAIDDFGTGHSSLSYLTRLPVCEVKIDRSFVRSLTPGSREAAVVRSTIDLGHHLGLRVVAEGVEDRMTLDELRRLGSDLAQGYGISRPHPADELTRFLHACHATWQQPRLPGTDPVEIFVG